MSTSRTSHVTDEALDRMWADVAGTADADEATAPTPDPELLDDLVAELRRRSAEVAR